LAHPRSEVAHVVLADAHAQVYAVHERGEAGPPALTYFGCAYGGSRAYETGQSGAGSSGSGGSSYEPKVLAGTNVVITGDSYSTVGWGPEQTENLWVKSLRTGKVLRYWSSTERLGITTAVVKPDGAVAWIAASGVNGSTGAHEERVYASDRSGLRTLASGSNIDIGSLALAGSTIYWTQGGRPYSAPLD
jgi:hypothetical protein